MASISTITSGNIDNSVNPIFMATGNTTTGNQSSPDGINWTARTLPSAIAWTGLTYGLGLSVAIGTGTAGCATSPDGVTWTARTMPSSAVWYAVAFSGTRFVAVSNGSTSAAYSDDGVTWTASTMNASGNWKSIAYGNGTFVAVNNASGTNTIITNTSSDGINWTTNTITLTGTGSWTSIAYGNNKFVAVSSGGTVAAESTDGINWTARTLPASKSWNSVCYGNSGFVAVPSDASNVVGAFSADGTTWSQITLPASVGWVAVTYGYGRYAAVASSTSSAASSFDGINWTARIQTSAAYVACQFFPFPWNSGDTLAINNGATVTVNTDQKKFWSTITINNGTLAISNSGTTLGSAITFSMGRLTGAVANTITPTSGLGKITINGAFINLGTGSGSAGQSVTTPYTDYIASVWVETASGSGVFETWLNATGSYGSSTPVFNDGLTAVSSGKRGKFFKQVSNGSATDGPIILANAAGTIASRIITCTSTAGVIPGCSVTGTGVAATAVVQNVISSTKLEVNLVHTATFSAGTLTCYNPYRSQLTNQIIFGDGVNGNLVPTGANIKIPNILITDLTPANIQTSSGALSAKIVMTNGGSLQASTCLFDESYNDFGQANSIAITNVGFSIPFTISECYQFTANNLAFSLIPVRRYFGTYWNMRDLRTGYGLAWSYISGANIQNFKMANYSGNAYIGAAAAATTPGLHLGLSFTDLATFKNCSFYALNPAKVYGSVAISANNGLTNSTFTNIEAFGCQPLNLYIGCSGNTFTNITHSSDMFNGVTNLPTSTAFRIYNDPSTGAALLNNTQYFLKVRSFRTWNDRTQYFEGSLASFGTQNGDKLLMVPKISAISTAANTVRLDWEAKAPYATIAIYEIYRGTSAGFSRTGAARLTNIVAGATITYSDTTATTGSTYYYGLRKHSFQYATITNSSGTSGTTTITSTMNMGTALGNTGLVVNAPSGSTKLYFAPAFTVTSSLSVGMQVGHASIPANTTIVSIDDVNEITISNATTAVMDRQSLTVGVGAGMGIFGTGVAIGCKVVSISTDGLTLTVDTANTAAVSGTLTFTGGVFDSNDIQVISQGAPKTATNLLLQSNTLATSWTMTTCTATSGATTGVHDTNLGTAATLTASKLAITSTTGNATISPATTSSSTYTFGVWLRTDLTAAQIAGVSGTISLGTQSTSFTVTDKWQYFSSTFTATASTTAATITINGVSGNYIFVSGAFVTIAASATTLAGMPIATTTAAVTLNPAVQEITYAYAYSRSATKFLDNQGVEVTIGALPAGTLWSELYLGTTSNFTPSVTNRVGNTLPCTASLFNLQYSCSNNTIDTLTIEGNGGISGNIAAASFSYSCSNNKLLNFTVNAPTWYGGQIAGFINLCNNNLIHNWKLTGIKSNSGIDMFSSSNNCSGQLIQNVIVNRAPDLYSNMQALNTEFRNVTSGSNAPLTTATTYALGNADGVVVSGAAQYDYMFLEMNFSSNKGALFIRFNASSKATKPYTITGTAYFDNTGRLYFNNVGDSIEIVWPHKILGVSGFQKRRYKAFGIDLGLDTDILQALYKEYSIDTGSGYGAYKEMTPENLSSETVSASSGFNFKVRLTALYAFKYPSFTNRYEIGEVIKGTTSLATATVVQDYRSSTTTGTVILSGINGTFVPGETLVRNSDSQARSPSTAVTGGSALQFNYPFLSSNINGLQIPTIVDETVKYPSTIITLTLTGLISGSDIVVLTAGTTTQLINVDSNPGTTYGYIYSSTSTVDIGIFKSGYVPFYIRNYTLSSSDASLPVAQVADRNYV
jgi:hypothetical protein